jgi:hypothetical protein
MHKHLWTARVSKLASPTELCRLFPGQGQEAEPLLAKGGVIPEELLGAEALFFNERGGLKAAGKDLPP